MFWPPAAADDDDAAAARARPVGRRCASGGGAAAAAAAVRMLLQLRCGSATPQGRRCRGCFCLGPFLPGQTARSGGAADALSAACSRRR
eukprot:SAG31_NODE_29583_length_392_cov_92.058020_1_plen_88_part_10